MQARRAERRAPRGRNARVLRRVSRREVDDLPGQGKVLIRRRPRVAVRHETDRVVLRPVVAHEGVNVRSMPP